MWTLLRPVVAGSHRADSGPIRGQAKWDFWWAKWKLHEPFFRYSPANLTPVAFNNYIAFTYYYRCVYIVIFNFVKCMLTHFSCSSVTRDHVSHRQNTSDSISLTIRYTVFQNVDRVVNIVLSLKTHMCRSLGTHTCNFITL